jgi:hypothetical protein
MNEHADPNKANKPTDVVRCHRTKISIPPIEPRDSRILDIPVDPLLGNNRRTHAFSVGGLLEESKHYGSVETRE